MSIEAVNTSLQEVLNKFAEAKPVEGMQVSYLLLVSEIMRMYDKYIRCLEDKKEDEAVEFAEMIEGRISIAKQNHMFG